MTLRSRLERLEKAAALKALKERPLWRVRLERVWACQDALSRALEAGWQALPPDTAAALLTEFPGLSEPPQQPGQGEPPPDPDGPGPHPPRSPQDALSTWACAITWTNTLSILERLPANELWTLFAGYMRPDAIASACANPACRFPRPNPPGGDCPLCGCGDCWPASRMAERPDLYPGGVSA